MTEQLSKALYKLPNLLRPPHNLKEYEHILDAALDQGYRFLTLGDLNTDHEQSSNPFMILRHDIDTNPHAAMLFAQVEQAKGIKATYFFRLNTWCPKLQNILHRRGHEVGYHFEELSDFAIKHHLKDKQSVIAHLPDIIKEFMVNLSNLQQTVDYPINAFAAHGDFTYPVLDLGNRFFMKDTELRKVCSIAYEAYDEALVQKYCNHLSDKPAPQNYYPESPLNYIKRQENLLLLTHPRWWIPDPWGNFRSDLKGYYRQLRW